MPSPTSMTVPTLTSEVSALAPSNWVMRRLITSVISSAIAIILYSSALWLIPIARCCRDGAIIRAAAAAANDLVAQESQAAAHTAIDQGVTDLGNDAAQNFRVHPGFQRDVLAGERLQVRGDLRLLGCCQWHGAGDDGGGLVMIVVEFLVERLSDFRSHFHQFTLHQQQRQAERVMRDLFFQQVTHDGFFARKGNPWLTQNKREFTIAKRFRYEAQVTLPAVQRAMLDAEIEDGLSIAARYRPF